MSGTAMADALPDGVPSGLRGRTKRLADLLIGLVIVTFIAPLLVAIFLAVRLTDGGPALYRHVRIGQNGRTFTLYKFRTMVRDADSRLASLLREDDAARREFDMYRKLRIDPRVTRFGAFLRRSSLDELPQLLNVIRGEMSLVGPRPIIEEELRRFGALRPVYEAARPGITGLWQVSGRNRTDFTTRVQLDTQYVRDWSFRTDLRILARTVPAVLLARGAF